jgi:plasmid stabilization system protein ParE
VGGIVFTSTAGRQVAQILDWYVRARPGLAREFLDEIRACLVRVGRHPQAFPAIAPPVRRALLRKFPYAIWYDPTPKAIIVRAVRHQARPRG